MDLHLPPDTDRVVKAMIDYLATRPDVDLNQIGLEGISMGGYGVPRAASGEKRVRAAFMSSGSYDLGNDLFDYLPSIQERVRWIIGAKDLADARKKLRDYTLGGPRRQDRLPHAHRLQQRRPRHGSGGRAEAVPGGGELQAGYGRGHWPQPGLECRRTAGYACSGFPRLDDEATRRGELEARISRILSANSAERVREHPLLFYL